MTTKVRIVVTSGRGGRWSGRDQRGLLGAGLDVSICSNLLTCTLFFECMFHYTHRFKEKAKKKKKKRQGVGSGKKFKET